MSRLNPPSPAKLVIGAFMQQRHFFEPVAETLENRFGPIDIVSKWFSFDLTTYYETEMGSGLGRRMMSFQNPISQDQLPDIKGFTNDMEQNYCRGENRQVNIDPGYLLPERFVLATGKNFAHRIYIGKNVYADLTLIYHDKAFKPLPWTYPDYTRSDMQGFLYRVRKKHIYDQKVEDLPT